MIEDLSDQTNDELLALFRLGRGDKGVTVADWEGPIRSAMAFPKNETAGYLIYKAQLV